MKRVHDLEASKVFGVSDDSMMYNNEQEKLCKMVEQLTLKRSLELEISRGTYFDWKKKSREEKAISLKKIREKILITAQHHECSSNCLCSSRSRYTNIISSKIPLHLPRK